MRVAFSCAPVSPDEEPSNVEDDRECDCAALFDPSDKRIVSFGCSAADLERFVTRGSR